MKKKKLQLRELKVKSFITNIEMNKTKAGGRLEDDIQDEKAIGGNSGLPWNIRVHAWTISEIRNDGRPHTINKVRKR